MSEPFFPTYLMCEGGPDHGKAMELHPGAVRPARIAVGFPHGVGCVGEYVEDAALGVFVWRDFTWRDRVRGWWAGIRLNWLNAFAWRLRLRALISRAGGRDA